MQAVSMCMCMCIVAAALVSPLVVLVAIDSTRKWFKARNR